MKKITLFNLCGHRFLGVNESGEKVMVDGDQPATGMRPMELLLTALSSCTAYDVIDIMEKKRQPLSRYRVEATDTQAEEHPKRYTHIHLVHYGAGPAVTEEALKRAVELSHTKYCSVSASLNAEIAVAAIVEPWAATQIQS